MDAYSLASVKTRHLAIAMYVYICNPAYKTGLICNLTSYTLSMNHIRNFPCEFVNNVTVIYT